MVESRAVLDVFEKSVLVTKDGERVNIYVTRRGHLNRGDVVIHNAVGMPVDVVCNLASALAKSHRVITWESRGLPSESADPETVDVAYSRQIQDALDVLGYFNVRRAVLVGWCSGAKSVIDLHNVWEGVSDALVLLNGAYNLDIAYATASERSVRTSMPEIAESRALADMYFKAVFAPQERASHAGIDGCEVVLRSMNGDDVSFAALPFMSAHNLYIYARLVTEFFRAPFRLIEADQDVPTLVMTGADDESAGTESSNCIAGQISCATLVVADPGDHYSLHWDPEYIGRIVDFCDINQIDI